MRNREIEKEAFAMISAFTVMLALAMFVVMIFGIASVTLRR
jgi:hypothetical protein